MALISTPARTLAELGENLGLEVIGDSGALVLRVDSPETAQEGSLCAVWDASLLGRLPSGVLLLGRREAFSGGRSGLVAENPKAVLPLLLMLFAPKAILQQGVHPAAVVAPDAEVSPKAWVGPTAVVGSRARLADGVQVGAGVCIGNDCVIGEGTVLEPRTVLLDGVHVGKDCLLHSGCVLGCDGFGFVPTPNGPQKIPQIGSVVVGDNVEIGACTTIDRGTIGDTVIGSGTKIDNHVQIGHNVRVGSGCIICAMSGVAGSSVLEDGVILSVQAGVTDHVRVGKGCVVAGRSGVTKDIPAGMTVSGFPARDHRAAKKAQVMSLQLPKLFDRLKKVERILRSAGSSVAEE